jgi:hypothetical protein
VNQIFESDMSIKHKAVVENGAIRIETPELPNGTAVDISIEPLTKLSDMVGAAKRLGESSFKSIEEVDAFINELRGERSID